MTQFKGASPRRVSSGGNLDVYTVLTLAGVFSLIVLAGTLWMKGGELASTGGGKASPWTIISK